MNFTRGPRNIMMRPRLYVKSQRTTVITGRVSMESFGAVHTTTDYAEGSVHVKLSGQDAYARDLLKRSGVDFETVDLSKGFRSKIGARIAGISRTPTLRLEDSPERFYVGIEAISRYLNEKKNEQ